MKINEFSIFSKEIEDCLIISKKIIFDQIPVLNLPKKCTPCKDDHDRNALAQAIKIKTMTITILIKLSKYLNHLLNKNIQFRVR